MTQDALDFYQAELGARLGRMPPENMAAFAACCAQRLYPACVRYFELKDDEQGAVFSGALEAIWSTLMDEERDAAALGTLESRCADAIPDDDEAFSAGEPYAEDACTAIVMTLRAMLTGDPRNAVWAAQCVYEALDNFVLARSGRQDCVVESGTLDPRIRRELQRQREDLSRLEGLRRGPLWRAELARLRAESRMESEKLYLEG